jgi:hypothetical protein
LAQANLFDAEVALDLLCALRLKDVAERVVFVTGRTIGARASASVSPVASWRSVSLDFRSI